MATSAAISRKLSGAGFCGSYFFSSSTTFGSSSWQVRSSSESSTGSCFAFSLVEACPLFIYSYLVSSAAAASTTAEPNSFESGAELRSNSTSSICNRKSYALVDWLATEARTSNYSRFARLSSCRKRRMGERRHVAIVALCFLLRFPSGYILKFGPSWCMSYL